MYDTELFPGDIISLIDRTKSNNDDELKELDRLTFKIYRLQPSNAEILVSTKTIDLTLSDGEEEEPNDKYAEDFEIGEPSTKNIDDPVTETEPPTPQDPVSRVNRLSFEIKYDIHPPSLLCWIFLCSIEWIEHTEILLNGFFIRFAVKLKTMNIFRTNGLRKILIYFVIIQAIARIDAISKQNTRRQAIFLPNEEKTVQPAKSCLVISPKKLADGIEQAKNARRVTFASIPTKPNTPNIITARKKQDVIPVKNVPTSEANTMNNDQKASSSRDHVPMQFKKGNRRIAHVPKVHVPVPDRSNLNVPKANSPNGPSNRSPRPESSPRQAVKRGSSDIPTSTTSKSRILDSLLTPPELSPIDVIEEPENHAANLINTIVSWKPTNLMNKRFNGGHLTVYPVPRIKFENFAVHERLVCMCLPFLLSRSRWQLLASVNFNSIASCHFIFDSSNKSVVLSIACYEYLYTQRIL